MKQQKKDLLNKMVVDWKRRSNVEKQEKKDGNDGHVYHAPVVYNIDIRAFFRDVGGGESQKADIVYFGLNC